MSCGGNCGNPEVSLTSVGHKELGCESLHHYRQQATAPSSGCCQSSTSSVNKRRISGVALHPPHRGPLVLIPQNLKRGMEAFDPCHGCHIWKPVLRASCPFRLKLLCYAVPVPRLLLCFATRATATPMSDCKIPIDGIDADYSSPSRAHMLGKNCRFEDNGLLICGSMIVESAPIF